MMDASRQIYLTELIKQQWYMRSILTYQELFLSRPSIPFLDIDLFPRNAKLNKNFVEDANALEVLHC